MPVRSKAAWGTWIPANQPGLRWEGRLRFDADRAATFDFASVRLHAGFEGTGLAIYARLGQNYLDVIVDGERVAVLGRAPKVDDAPMSAVWVKPAASGGVPVFRVQGLKPGKHSLIIAKRTSPNFGPVTFLGFRLDEGAKLLAAEAAPARRLEFIGDSLTNGYGDEGPGLACKELPPYENSSLSFARVCAEALQADAQLLAYSGYGLLRNYGDKEPRSKDPMPTYYPRTVLSEAKGTWDRGRYKPDLAAILLGTNDYSTEPHPSDEDFLAAYRDLLDAVRDGRPGLPILCLYRQDLPACSKLVKQLVKEEQAKGHQVEALGLPILQQSDCGCDWHPKVHVHAAWAELVTKKIRNRLNW